MKRERRRAEEEVRETEERYRLAAHATNDAILGLDLATDQSAGARPSRRFLATNPRRSALRSLVEAEDPPR